MNILQDIDSTLHYENIEKAWHKYKYVFILALVALFAGIAGLNAYNSKVMAESKSDTDVVIAVMNEAMVSETPTDVILASTDEVTTKQGLEILKLELAKAYKKENKPEELEKTLLELISAKSVTVKQFATYMLAEHYLATKPTKAIEFINSVKLSKKAFTTPLVEEVKAMALAHTGKTAEAKAIYIKLIASGNVQQQQKSRLKMKLDQLG